MKNIVKVHPSEQVDSTLPRYIAENYEKFVEFMTAAAESEERISFGQDILQNLLEYRDFDFYQNRIVEHGILDRNYDDRQESIPGRDFIQLDSRDRHILSQSQIPTNNDLDIIVHVDADILTLVDGYGFPEKNGVLLIDDEIILYRYKIGNKFYELQRGASGTSLLPTFTAPGEYLQTEPQEHLVGSKVYNLSSLFICAILESIHDTYTRNIDRKRVTDEVNRSSILKHIGDFFRSKGSKLGIKALFKMLFAENDVDVSYPGDKMVIPSESTWTETLILRVVPIPEIVCQLSDLEETYTDPDKLIGSELFVKSYNDNLVYGRVYVDYVSSYPYEDVTQYEIYVEKDNLSGSVPANPTSVLTRNVEIFNTSRSRTDRTTITVETTLGFPDSGVIFIDNEGIFYESKTYNQFLNCRRGYIGVEANHSKGSTVYGPYFLEGQTIDEGVTYKSRMWPLGLVQDVDIRDPGILHTVEDLVTPGGPGRVEPREPALKTILENYTDVLATQYEKEPAIGYIGDYTHGPSGVYFDDDNIFISSTNLPADTIGPFSIDGTVGPDLTGINALHVFPRRHSMQPNTQFLTKGQSTIGMFVDGVPAYSNVSNDKVRSGKITAYNIIDGGSDYVNPTLLINGNKVENTITIDKGVVIHIGDEDDTNYTDVVDVELTSGRDGLVRLEFDPYGRVIEAVVVNGGEYYLDDPTIKVVDSSFRGKGALLKPIVEGGKIKSIEIAEPGIDFNPLTTTAVVVPIGSGFVAEGVVQYWQPDRFFAIDNNNTVSLDENGGFLFEPNKSSFRKERYGYMGYPTKLAQRLNESTPDDTSSHSPLLGWAFDGNPIYGSVGYANKKDDSAGFVQYSSSYSITTNRGSVIPSGGDIPSTLPPDPSIFPLGTFVEDYVYTPGELDENNGVVMNTPEFPVEYYPDGVYCYIATTEAGKPSFPYIIGRTFNDRPISQKLLTEIEETIEPINFTFYDPEGSYDTTPLVFDYDVAERYRNEFLESTKDDLRLEVADISTGSISEIKVENNLPSTSMVGDVLVYENKDTKGAGAEGKVSYVTGKDVENAVGENIETFVVSHVQQINLVNVTINGVYPAYVFVEGTYVITAAGVIGKVLDWDPLTKLLVLRILTKELITYGDVFYDNRKQRVFIQGQPQSSTFLDEMSSAELLLFDRMRLILDGYNETVLELEHGETYVNNLVDVDTFSTTTGFERNTYYSVLPPDGTPMPGDLWYSGNNGRLYIYYKDEDSEQWVCTQPLGMRPLSGAQDFGVGNQATTLSNIVSPQEENYVMISTTAPISRTDGSPNQFGDLWWSNHTGILYIWYTNEWINTDPIGTVPQSPGGDYSSDYANFGYDNPTPPTIEYESKLTVIISYTSPTIMDDGSPLRPGILWWCPLTGKMYIYYDNTWVISTLISMQSTKWSMDEIIDGGGETIRPPIIIIPEPIDPDGGGGGGGGSGGGNIGGELDGLAVGTSGLWFENLNHFEPGHNIKFYVGAPRNGETEVAKLLRIVETGTPAAAIVSRSEDQIELPDRTITINQDRSLYRVKTAEPHGLKKGDKVIFENSLYDEVNGEHEIIEAGSIVPAQGVAIVENGTVTRIEITDPGKYYRDNFYVWWYGGGGTGGYGYATVKNLKSGGGVASVDVTYGGVNYTSSPTIVFGDHQNNDEFVVYMSQTYGDDPNVTYITDSNNAEGAVARVRVTSPGLGYEKLPYVLGLDKLTEDRARTRVHLNGQQIESVDVEFGGFRYEDPTAYFVDLTGNGSGAEAEVITNEGIVTAVNVTNPGDEYIEPYLMILDDKGTYITLTEDIGQLKSFRIIDPGRTISADRSLKPELMITTRVIVDPTPDTPATRVAFIPGENVYQGEGDSVMMNAVFSSYDENTHVITLNNVNGTVKEGELLYSDTFPTGVMVLKEGQTDSRVFVDGVSSPIGRFIDEKSFVSSDVSVIQDSYYYQWFSYVISSPIQQSVYDTIVRKLVHPVGFKLFSDLTIRSESDGLLKLNEIEPEIESIRFILSTSFCQNILVMGGNIDNYKIQIGLADKLFEYVSCSSETIEL